MVFVETSKTNGKLLSPNKMRASNFYKDTPNLIISTTFILTYKYVDHWKASKEDASNRREGFINHSKREISDFLACTFLAYTYTGFTVITFLFEKNPGKIVTCYLLLHGINATNCI